MRAAGPHPRVLHGPTASGRAESPVLPRPAAVTWWQPRGRYPAAAMAWWRRAMEGPSPALDPQWIIRGAIAEDVAAVVAKQNPPDGARLTTTWPGPSSPALRPRAFAGSRNHPAVPRVPYLPGPGRWRSASSHNAPRAAPHAPASCTCTSTEPEGSRTAMRRSARPGRRRAPPMNLLVPSERPISPPQAITGPRALPAARDAGPNRTITPALPRWRPRQRRRRKGTPRASERRHRGHRPLCPCRS
jgi:hypothetical protein